MGGKFEVNEIGDPQLLKKYADFVRCDCIDGLNMYRVSILKGRRNRQLPCTVDPQSRPRICHILDNGVHVHQDGQGGVLEIIEGAVVSDQQTPSVMPQKKGS